MCTITSHIDKICHAVYVLANRVLPGEEALVASVTTTEFPILVAGEMSDNTAHTCTAPLSESSSVLSMLGMDTVAAVSI